MIKFRFFKKLWKFFSDNYFLAIFFAGIAFIGVVSVYKLFFVKPLYVYAKVKMGQGLWWASTQKPSFWFIDSLKKIQEEKDLTGQPIAKILSIRYYPYWESNQYNVYLIMKLKVTGNPKTGKYNFKRSTIGVGSPVDFEFPQAQFSGTIIELSEKPIKEKLIKKTIYITKPFAYHWEFDNIKLTDYYFDGQEKTLEVVDKSIDNVFSNIILFKSVVNLESRVSITVKLKIKVKVANNKIIFGEEQIISVGKTINITTDNFYFQDYQIAKIEE